MYSPILVTPPAAAPISLEAAKAHLRVDDEDSDALITGFIQAAVSLLDGPTGLLGRCLMPQTWRQQYDFFTYRFVRLPLFPVASVTTVAYDDLGGIERTIDAANFKLLNDECGAYIRFNNAFGFPGVNNEYPSVRVTYVTGYADAASVPQGITQAMLLLIEHWYTNRGAVLVDSRAAAVEVPFGVKALLAPFRRVGT